MKDAYTITMVPAIEAGRHIPKLYIGPDGIELITQTRVEFPGMGGLPCASVHINCNHPIRGDSKIAIVEPAERDEPSEKTDIEKLREAKRLIEDMYIAVKVRTIEESVFQTASSAISGAIRVMESKCRSEAV